MTPKEQVLAVINTALDAAKASNEPLYYLYEVTERYDPVLSEYVVQALLRWYEVRVKLEGVVPTAKPKREATT